MRLFEQRKPKAIRHFPGKTAMVLAVLLLAHAFLFGPAAAEERPVKLMIVSDLHYLAPSLYAESDGSFEKALKQGDGKMSHCSRELLEGLVLEARHRRRLAAECQPPADGSDLQPVRDGGRAAEECRRP